MKVLIAREQQKQAVDSPLPSKSAIFIAAVSFVFFPSTIFSQASSFGGSDVPVSYSGEALSEALPPFPLIEFEYRYGAYDQRQVEPLKDLAGQKQELGEYQQALVLYTQALHISRVNNGLYHEAQIAILDNIINSQIALRDWKAVDDRYAYLEHLYRRLYAVDDPRLELGLQKVVSWHVNAFNVNLDGRQVDHLRQANKLFKLRLQVAELTLASGDPKFEFLNHNIAICERQLYLASDLNKEIRSRRQEAWRNPLIADID